MTAKLFDPTLKDLVEIEPENWPVLLRQPPGPTAVIDADIATITGAADKILRVGARPPYLLHLEFVSGHDSAALPRTLHVRNALLEDRHDMPVRSGIILLRPEADSPQLTGTYQRAYREEEPYLTFRYQVLRVWQLAPAPLLAGGLATMALAPISAVTEAELPGIIKQMEQRLSGKRSRRQAQVVWAAAYILLGLRYSSALAGQLFRGVVSMKESSTYQAILQEGRDIGRDEGKNEGAVAEARKVLRLLGEDLFGIPDASAMAAIDRLDDLHKLEELIKQVRTATSWQHLLGPTSSRRRSNRKS